MRIVFFITALDYSGAPKMLAWVANQMYRQGHSVKILAMYSDKQLQSLDEGVEFSYIGLTQSKSRFVRNTFGMVNAVHHVHKAIKKEAPDVIVNFLDSVGYMYILKNRFSKRYKMIVSERSDPYAHRGWSAKIRHWLLNMADTIVFQTEGAKNFFDKNEKIIKKSVIIPNPIIPRNTENRISPVSYSDRDNRIVSVGRLEILQKRQDLMIDAFEIIHRKHPELELHIYGEGNDKEKIQDIIDSRGLQSCVFLRGRTNDVENEIRKARAFVLTSDFEGIPNALIEAMLAGVPSVSTDCSPGGAALLINDGENGFIVQRENCIALAEAMTTLIENEEISNKFSSSSPLIAERFSEIEISKQWKDCFEQLKNDYC